jgi:hypothetical protein
VGHASYRGPVGVKLGSNPRKADENHSLSHRNKSNQSILAAKWTVAIPSGTSVPMHRTQRSRCVESLQSIFTILDEGSNDKNIILSTYTQS